MEIKNIKENKELKDKIKWNYWPRYSKKWSQK
jgi:hypothetical protein